MNELEPAGNGYLRYKRDGYWGVMSNQGKILIDTKRGYTSIGDYKTTNKRFDYTMNGYRGECDATGRQISKIKVNTPISSSSSSSSKTSSLDKSSISNTYHDVVAFELKGKVKRCKLESESVSNGYNITFDERGKLASIGKFGDEKIFDLKRSGNGYLISFKSSSTGGIVKHREYVYSNNKLTKTKLYETYDSDISISLFESIYSAALSSMLEFDRVSEFFYSNNIIVKCISITKDSEKEEKDIFIYSNYKYDKHGNWISRSVKENGKSYIEKRIIEYY